MSINPENSSFRDRDAVIYNDNGKILRKIFNSYKENYDKLMTSGLYEKLISQNLLINHTEYDKPEETNVYKIIEPKKVFITYPYEWSFNQYKDAALATLKIQQIALEFNMSLKDTSAFNIQFFEGKPLLIDTTSFEKFEEKPWVAYKQFCKHFLAPLLIMKYIDPRCAKFFLTDIDGLDLEIVSKILPKHTKFNPGILTHIHLHSKFLKQYSSTKKKSINQKMTKFQHLAILDGLMGLIKGLEVKTNESEWKNYYNNTNYTESSFEEKKKLIEQYKKLIDSKIIWDFGANTGHFSRIFKDTAKEIICFDIDYNAVDENYKTVKTQNETNILPLVFDLVNPSPNIGWANEERKTILERANNVDIALALALIHHLAISNNLPFNKIAQYFSQISRYLIIEFVKKEDSKVQELLNSRKDIFNDYDIEHFENSFSKYYTLVRKDEIKDTQRILYLFKVKE